MIDNVLFMGIVCLMVGSLLVSVMAVLIVHGGHWLIGRVMRRRKRTDGGN